jgi:hypothetical protein
VGLCVLKTITIHHANFSYGTISDASPNLSAGLNAGNGTNAAVLPFASNGTFSRTQAIGLSDRIFAFTPSGNSYAVTEVPEPSAVAGLVAVAIGGCMGQAPPQSLSLFDSRLYDSCSLGRSMACPGLCSLVCSDCIIIKCVVRRK